MGTGHPLSWAAIGCLARGFRSIGCCSFVKNTLNIQLASNRLPVGPQWHHSLLTLGGERLNGTRLGRGALNIHTVDIALDFSYVKWPPGTVSTSGIFRSANVKLMLDCPCCAVVTKRVKRHWCLKGDWGQTAQGNCPFCLYYIVFLILLFLHVMYICHGNIATVAKLIF